MKNAEGPTWEGSPRKIGGKRQREERGRRSAEKNVSKPDDIERGALRDQDAGLVDEEERKRKPRDIKKARLKKRGPGEGGRCLGRTIEKKYLGTPHVTKKITKHRANTRYGHRNQGDDERESVERG